MRLCSIHPVEGFSLCKNRLRSSYPYFGINIAFEGKLCRGGAHVSYMGAQGKLCRGAHVSCRGAQGKLWRGAHVSCRGAQLIYMQF